MKCPTCSSPLTLLFTSAVCDRCDRPSAPATTGDRVGWVVCRLSSRGPGAAEYVFKTQQSAEVWRVAAGLERFPVRSVAMSAAGQWRAGTGSVPGLELDGRLWCVYPERPTVCDSSFFAWLDPQ